jgi:transposase InsO family protein
VRQWIAEVGAKTAYIEPGSPWENGYCKSFNSKLRDELLNIEVFSSLKEAKVVMEDWRRLSTSTRSAVSGRCRSKSLPVIDSRTVGL